MIDIETENLVAFSEVPRTLASRPNLSQVYRWAMRGLRGTKLEFVQLGGRRYTSKEALARFCERLTNAAAKKGGAYRASTPVKRRRNQMRAESELAAAGYTVGGD